MKFPGWLRRIFAKAAKKAVEEAMSEAADKLTDLEKGSSGTNKPTD